MTGFYVAVPKMKLSELKKFVKTHMLTPEQLLQKARRKKVPKRCRSCKAPLEEFVESYREIPCEDLTIFFRRLENVSHVIQYASSCCSIIRGELRQIVQAHIARELRKAGYTYEVFTG